MPTATCDTCDVTVVYRGTRGGGLAGSRHDCGGTLRGDQAGRKTGPCAACGRRTNLRVDQPWMRSPLWAEGETLERVGPFPADTFCCRSCSGGTLDGHRWSLDNAAQTLARHRDAATGRRGPETRVPSPVAIRAQEAQVKQHRAAVEALVLYAADPEKNADRIRALAEKICRTIPYS